MGQLSPDGEEEKKESVCKPGSVWDSHSSRASVTAGFKQPTRIHCGPQRWIPIWPCSEWGLPSPRLLPAARCALTAPFHPYLTAGKPSGGILSVALSVGSRPPGVTWHSARWSPDFPPPAKPQAATAQPILMEGYTAYKAIAIALQQRHTVLKA